MNATHFYRFAAEHPSKVIALFEDTSTSRVFLKKSLSYVSLISCSMANKDSTLLRYLLKHAKARLHQMSDDTDIRTLGAEVYKSLKLISGTKTNPFYSYNSMHNNDEDNQASLIEKAKIIHLHFKDDLFLQESLSCHEFALIYSKILLLSKDNIFSAALLCAPVEVKPILLELMN